jgi:2-oxoglutarate ferredoxin oxidoreductase subunit alpha
MGIPVNGKNIFPSNIQGLPTWFTIRLSREGYVARRDTSEVLVAMNQATIMEDIRDLPPDGVCFYPEEWAIRHERDDVVYYAMPVKALMSGMDIPANLRDYVVNMTYVGFVSALLGIEINEVEAALNIHFKGKASAVALNMKVANAAYEWAMDNVAKQDVYTVKRLEKTNDKIILDGNSAAALGAVFGGVTMAAWYPITPSTSLIDSLKDYLADLRHDADGKATYAIVQAEDELAAIGMVVGASWAGARAMTATSGPGLSLMTEFVGFAYFTEIPAVIWDVQRVGPSTGLPTRTAQGDLLTVYFMGHGDTKHVCLLPSNISECFEFGWRALDLAERLQTPVFVLSDLDLGMNLWMSDPFEYPSEALDRGKVLTAEDLDRLGEFGRYKDVDGDGIPYRTLPGTNHPKAPYFTRGSGHNENAEYSERPRDWANNMARLGRKFDTARSIVPQPVVSEVKGAKIGLIAYGSSDPAIVEGRDRLDAKGIKTSYLRLRALPLNDTTRKFIAKYDRIYVVENNTDGQMYKLLCMEYPDIAGKMQSLASSTGLPLSARWLTAEVSKKEGVK